MSLVDKFDWFFGSGVTARGNAYFRSGRVGVVRFDDERTKAQILGSDLYDVSLERDGRVLLVDCSCPYSESYGMGCKHVVALILEAERRGLAVVEGVDDIEFGDEDDDEYDDDYDDDDYEPEPRPRIQFGRPRAPGWRDWMPTLRSGVRATNRTPENWPASRRVIYVVDLAKTLHGYGVALEYAFQDLKKNGEWSAPKTHRLYVTQIPLLPEPIDRRILSMLAGARSGTTYGYAYEAMSNEQYLMAPLAAEIFPLLGETGRLFIRPVGSRDIAPTRWDDGPPWAFRLEMAREGDRGSYEVTGWLERGSARRPLAEPLLLASGGLVVDRDRIARLDDAGAFAWITLLRQTGLLKVPAKEVDAFLGELYSLPAMPPIELPEELRFEEVAVPPVLHLKVSAPKAQQRDDRLRGELSFDYDGVVVPESAEGKVAVDVAGRRLVARDAEAEGAAGERLSGLGFRVDTFMRPPARMLKPKRLPRLVRDLVADGWNVEAEGKIFRRPGAFDIRVSSGVDWFDLEGSVDYGGTTVSLPALLEAARRGEETVLLDDGTFGILPEQWLEKYGGLAGLGTAEGEALRFRRSQAGLLDALLAAQPEIRVDRVFAKVRKELADFSGVEAANAPKAFTGELREYQREGLGWMRFLERFGFGGCLADDMGLGKTVQVLALLAGRRAKPRLPSLVVVPRSLVFNWKLEAARFAPKLRVLDHTGPDREKHVEAFASADLVVTTYGILRRDAPLFAEADFDYVILDEAQAIKNATTESAKAARLLRGRHRLALSGTPIENHLGELWSLFEFLNPGLLGAASAFQRLGAGEATAAPETREMLARALRPFILRRTKDQVAKDLPPKTEQTIYCELDARQRKLYDHLKSYYRDSLLGRIERDGIKRSKIQILEALLRLRQAACHPGLVDPKRVTEPSAKLDALLSQIEEVVSEGHKTLVFSQFTKMLAIVRDRLDRDKVVYEYLDGRTRDRASKVDRFQTDPDCKLFLISLKAGGLGLNLTAAEYVFLLDPWWNPAVEAQAIDRAHRIGQTESVFAYRLIAQDTVEEKVLELQKTKRALADAIINADNSLIRSLTGDDLALLLS